MAELKAAVIGLGMGRSHIAGYQKRPEVEVVAVADPDTRRLEELSGGGALIDLGMHRIDLAMWLMGYPEPRWVSGSTYEHFVEAILTDTPHTATAREGYTIMRIPDGIYESAAAGRPVELR